MAAVDRLGADDRDLSLRLGERDIWNLALALSGAATPLEIAGALAERGASAARAAFANMAICDRSTDRISLVHAPTLDPALTKRYSDLSLSDPTPLSRAISSGEPVLLGSLDGVGASYHHLLADTLAAGLEASASLPLSISGGLVVGAIGIGWSEPQAFGPEQMSRLRLIADITARALERAMLAVPTGQSPLELAEGRMLQQAFLPTTAARVEQLDLAAAYLPASDAPMGGDWYDAFPVDGVTCLVIGDVAGHGVRSAAVMSLLRNAARAFADEDPTPSRVLTRLNRMLLRLEPDETATAIVAVWDPAAGTLVRAHAGHLPPLQCRLGDVSFLESADGVLLGATTTPMFTDITTVVDPGTTVLLYTDGLVEFRTLGLDDGMRHLESFVAGLPACSPQALCDQVLKWRLASGRREDDLCILAVRSRSGARGAGGAGGAGGPLDGVE